MQNRKRLQVRLWWRWWSMTRDWHRVIYLPVITRDRGGASEKKTTVFPLIYWETMCLDGNFRLSPKKISLNFIRGQVHVNAVAEEFPKIANIRGQWSVISIIKFESPKSNSRCCQILKRIRENFCLIAAFITLGYARRFEGLREKKWSMKFDALQMVCYL